MAEGLMYGLRLTKAGREITKNELQHASEAEVDRKKARSAAIKENREARNSLDADGTSRQPYEAPRSDYTDYRSPDTMHFSGKELHEIKPTEADRLYAGSPNITYKSREDAQRYVNSLWNDSKIKASIIEPTLGSNKWAFRIESVPPMKPRQEVVSSAESLYPVGETWHNARRAAKENKAKFDSAGLPKKSMVQLGYVGPEEAARIKSAVGDNCVMFKRTMGAEEVFHALDRHGAQATQAGEPPIALSDFAKYQDIVSKPDRIYGTKKTGLVVYEKRYADYTYVITEQKEGNTLKFANLWKRKTEEGMRPANALTSPGRTKGERVEGADEKRDSE